MTIDYTKTAHNLEAAIRKAVELYEQEHGREPTRLQVIAQAEQDVRIAMAAEAREDLEIIAKVVREHHPELSEAQVVSKALEAYPEL
jgi:adenine-specific DNA methylase